MHPVAGCTIDTVIPLIDAHQAVYSDPDGHAPLDHAWIALLLSVVSAAAATGIRVGHVLVAVA